MKNDIPQPVELSRTLLRPVSDNQPWGEDGDVLDYVAASVQNAAERRPASGCWGGRWHSFEEIRGDGR